MSGLRIVFEQQAGSTVQFVREHLYLYNVGATGESTYYPLHLYLKNERDETMGGLTGEIWGGWLYVSILWVDPAVRGKGWATKLMNQAEALGRERQCHSAHLDTHSFQARPFYEKRGYEVFGTLDDYPKGHKRFFLRKKL
jgi:GNAT superfamily N-acetyltransferase